MSTIVEVDMRRARIEAQVSYEESRENLAALIGQVQAIGDRAKKIASRMRGIEIDASDPLRADSPLLALCASDFEGIDLQTVRNLAISIVEARKEMLGKKALAVAMNCKL